MPVHVLSKGAGPAAQIPAHLTSVPVSLIKINTDYSDKFVKGKVVCKGQLVSGADDNSILKAALQEEDSQSNASSINIVLMGTLAQEFNKAVKEGDVAVTSGFTVGRSPTVHKDRRHPFILLLSGDDACVYVSRRLQPPADPAPPPAVKRSGALSAEDSRKAKSPRYTYVQLDKLTAESVVCVYGVVVFFKQPFRSRGTDLCSSLKITDQSNQKVSCNIFCEKLDDHPKIFRVGDIIRLHRVKTQNYNACVTLINTSSSSVVTFDGTVGGALEGRTSSQSYSFDENDRRTIEELRSWSASQSISPQTPGVSLSGVQPKAYFNLTCQLLAKAPIHSSCMLLRVWDGTACPHTMLDVWVSPDVMEGPSSFSASREKLIANVLVYDNHVEMAQRLQVGSFLRIFNLRALQGVSKVPGLTCSQSEEENPMAFHLHGGTTYGRGIRVLPGNSPEVQELKRVIRAVEEEEEEVHDSMLLEICCSEQETDATKLQLSTERRCGHGTQQATLSQVKRSEPGRVHHVRVRLGSYEPRKLHQTLKLYCSRCTSLQEVPSDALVSDIFAAAAREEARCSTPPWAIAAKTKVHRGSSWGTLAVLLSNHLDSELRTKELMFLLSSTLSETRRIASGYPNIVPVRSSRGQPSLHDLAAPFLFRGRKRYYGCKRCSKPVVAEPREDTEVIDQEVIAEALGVQLLRHTLLMKLQLQDATDTLDAFLWRDAELFFGVSAEDAAVSQEAQDHIRKTLDSLCPPGSSTEESPWIDLCLAAYRAEDDQGRSQTCYQICHTAVSQPCNTSRSEPA